MYHQWSLSQYITYILLTLVVLSSWTDINGIYAELPQIILTQPEGWKLGAYLALITNLGNIAPLALVLIKCLCRKRTINPVPINYIVIFIGMLSCFLLIFFWSYTTIIGNEKRSTALLILAFFLSLLDCTSSISFADYIQRFRKEFISTMFLGESLTSILPSLLAIVQGNGQLRCIQSTNGTNATEAIYETARFSVSIYFLCLFILLTISFISFVLLQWTSIAQNTRQIIPETSLETTNTMDKSENSLTTSSYILLSLGCTYTSSILFGMILSISTFVLMPYGHRIFYLGTILSPWMFTLVWILGMIKPLLSKRYLLILIILGSITFAFDLFVSFKSPCPPWVDTTKGSVLILIVWLSTYVLLGYPRLVIANYVRIHSPNGMFWYGVNVQLGALIGSIVAYLLVETFSLFRERIPCEQITC
jgi:riboflavin transporter 2